MSLTNRSNRSNKGGNEWDATSEWRFQCRVDWEKSKQKRRINTMMELMKRLVKQEDGQDLVEYALLLVFLALAAIAVLPVLGQAVNNVFSQSASTLTAGS